MCGDHHKEISIPGTVFHKELPFIQPCHQGREDTRYTWRELISSILHYPWDERPFKTKGKR
jgi:hypothetical protein